MHCIEVLVRSRACASEVAASIHVLVVAIESQCFLAQKCYAPTSTLFLLVVVVSVAVTNERVCIVKTKQCGATANFLFEAIKVDCVQ